MRSLSTLLLFFFFLTIPHPPTSTLFPYTTLFRSIGPTLRDAAIIYDELQSVADLPAGWTDATHASVQRSEEHTSNSSHTVISYAVFCLKKKKKKRQESETVYAKESL